MNVVSIGEYHGLRVGSALLSIVAGCIIIGVSKDCDADAVGGIFLGAGGLELILSVHQCLKGTSLLLQFSNFRVHPMATNSNPAPEQPVATLTREEMQASELSADNNLGCPWTQSHLNVERSKSRMGTFVETIPTAAEGSQDDGPSTDIPDILGRRKFKSSDQDPS
ncbi:putative kinocilin [Triplophysa rosa]|uniref:Kinocilin n=1 Tax=Triplophysa rosa TaxID=992332 RepID=A0A9W7WXT5_TRIRA|nr:putative kinocilin [Triplophysa rosa]